MTLRDISDSAIIVKTESATDTSTSSSMPVVTGQQIVRQATASTTQLKTINYRDIPAKGQPLSTGTNWSTHDDVKELVACLRYRRPKGGRTEAQFITRFIDAEIDDLRQDECGNLYKIVGKENPDIVWSSHIDSVHRMEGEQAVVVDGDWLRLPKNSKSNCLGADDMAGIWLMRKMIAAGVPGMYIFHYGEESGGIGSGWIAENHPEYLRGVKFAVAFDRRNFTDVITHQYGGRCCSDNFARSLAKLLPNGYEPSDRGVFTDTANYISLIPECTNLSVGYQDEHSSDERLNIPHILALRDKLVQITQADLDGLVLERDPSVPDVEDVWSYSGLGSQGRSNRRRQSGVYKGKYGGTYQHLGSAYDNDPQPSQMYDFDREEEATDDLFGETFKRVGRESGSYMPQSLEELLESYPKSCAYVLGACYGIDVEDLWDEVQGLVRR